MPAIATTNPSQSGMSSILLSLRTNVYIDGFNFYYGAVKGTQHKWLNPRRLAEVMLDQRHDVRAIKYFTAKVKNKPWDPTIARRQADYFRALRTVDGLSIHLGHFISQTVSMPVASPRPGARFADVIKTEEKGSDVNLACHLLVDGFHDEYDVAVLISNDGDLKGPVDFVRRELKKPVGVLNPHSTRSRALSPTPLPRGSFYKRIRPAALEASQFPLELNDARGAFVCPESWR